MNCVICMLNSKYIHSSLAPWYLLAAVKAWCGDGVAAQVADLTINHELHEIADAIISKKPDVVGFCCYIWNIAAVRVLVPIVKAALPDTVIILGGPEVSYNAGEILSDAGWGRHVDFILSGEGERPFALLLDALNAGANAGTPLRGEMDSIPIGAINRPQTGAGALETIPGLCYRKGGQVIVKPPHVKQEEPPDPYGPEYFEALDKRIAYIETSRGCPFSCAFCLSGAGRGVRWFSLNRAKRDILRLAGSGTKTLKFVDRTFNADRNRARELFRYIIDANSAGQTAGVRFHFEIGGDLLDEETLCLLEGAPRGLFQFEIGLQSFNPRTLAAVNRKTDVERLKQNIRRLVAMGNIHIHIDLIAGLPHEDLTGFADSFNTAWGLRPHMLQLGFLKLLHGAAMRENPAKYPCRYSPEPPYAVIETPWLSEADLDVLHEAEDALGRLYNSGRFRRTLDYVLERTGKATFELFCDAGRLLAGRRMSLDALTTLIYDYFSNLPGVDGGVLRDKMARDRLSTNASGMLPEVLRRPDSRRGEAVLPTEGVVVTADYSRRDPVTGQYPLREVNLL